MHSVKTATTDIFIDGSSIIHIKTLPNAVVNLDDATDTMSIARILAGGKPAMILADIRYVRKISGKALQLFEKSGHAGNFKARAVLINSSLATYFKNLFQFAGYPVRIFSSEEKAISWLRSVR